MATIILPIKPVYSQQILNGTKTIELRKAVPSKSVDKIIIYESAPTSGIVGEVSVRTVIKAAPKDLYKEHSYRLGISKAEYDAYFKNSSVAYGYVLYNPVRYKHVENIQEYGLTAAPQNYVYIEEPSLVIDIEFVKNNYKKHLHCKFFEHDAILCGYSGNWAIIGFYDEFGCIRDFTDHVDFIRPDGCKSFRFIRPQKLKINDNTELF